MWDISRFVGLLLLLAHFSWAQNPADVSLTLSTKNGQTRFRQGEAISVELRFQSITPGKYQVITDPSQRIHLRGLRVYDRFTGEPAADAIDPLREQTRMLEPFVGPPPRQAPLNASSISIEQVVNDWISFRKAGRYRITAQTWRLSLVDNSKNSAPVFFPKPLPMQSNTVEIEIVPADDDWASKQLQNAVASLSRGIRPPTVGQFVDIQREKEIVAAARVLRFLETRDAGITMIRFFDRGPYNVQGDLVAGLYGSPYRNEIVSALEEGLTSPEVPVTQNWIDTLSELATARDFGPAPPYDKDPSGSEAWNKHFMAYRERYMAILSGAVARKQGQARAVSLDVLSYQNSPKPASPDSIAAVVENFQNLPENTQNLYLTMNWSRIASPEIEPLVLSLAKGTGQARDAALMRLQELDPAAARPIILDRIRKGDIPQGAYSDPRTLLLLPDRVLREMDRPLVEMLEQDKNVGVLISRYASDAMFERIQAWVEAHPYSVCGPILPYLFRVDPAYAADRLGKAQNSQPGCILFVSPSEDPFISPGLERAAIADLESPITMTQRAAQTLLQNGGSAAAEEPLFNGMEHLRESKRNPQDQATLETGYVEALTKGVGWVLSPEKLSRLSAACISDSCRQSVESTRRFTEPIVIEYSGFPDVTLIMIGQYSVHGAKQMDAKVRQFPRGTKFFFPSSYKGIWHYKQRMSEFRRILDAAGMLVVDQPVRN